MYCHLWIESHVAVVCNEREHRVEMSLRHRVAVELPYTVEEGVVDHRAVPNVMDLVEGAALANPPPEALEPRLILARYLSKFESPITTASPPAGCVPNPNLLFHCHAVNNALMKVRTRVTVKRRRRVATNEVISEEPIGAEVVAASWCGGSVVRDCVVARPADVVYFPHDLQDEHRSASREGDVHIAPTGILLSDRTVPGYHYRYLSQAVDQDGRAIIKRSYVSSAVCQPMGPLPKPTSQHLQFREQSMHRPEAVALTRLLARQPVWRTSKLTAALKEAGCTSSHLALLFVRSWTYRASHGPFHGLRIPFTCDPRVDAAAYAKWQLVILRINRRSALGVAIRDCSRMPNIRDVLHLCSTLQDRSVPTSEGMQAVVHDILITGALWKTVQLADAIDHAEFGLEASRYIQTFSPQWGYYTDESLQRMSRIILDEVRHVAMVQVPQALAAIAADPSLAIGLPLDDEPDSDETAVSDEERKRSRSPSAGGWSSNDDKDN